MRFRIIFCQPKNGVDIRPTPQPGQRILFSVVFTPFTPSHHSSVWVPPVISLLLTNTVSPVRACLIICRERFCGTQKRRRSWGLLVFNPLCTSPHGLHLGRAGTSRIERDTWHVAFVLDGLCRLVIKRYTDSLPPPPHTIRLHQLPLPSCISPKMGGTGEVYFCFVVWFGFILRTINLLKLFCLHFSRS